MIAGLILGLPFIVWGILGVIYEDEIEQGHWFYKLRVNKLTGLGFMGIGTFIILYGVLA